MKKWTLYLLLLFIFSCSSKDVVIEEISFLYDKSNAQPSLVSNNGNLSLTWISSDQDMNANLNFRLIYDDSFAAAQAAPVRAYFSDDSLHIAKIGPKTLQIHLNTG